MAGPTYVYTKDTPQADNPMNQTQNPILNNFRAINEWVWVNHVGFNNENSGKHNFLSMPNTTNPGANETEITMYTAVTGTPNPCEIFIQYPLGTNESQAPVQISNEIVSSTGLGVSGGGASDGWCSFDSGVVFRWGLAYTPAASGFPPGNGTITFSSGPQYTTYYLSSAISPLTEGCLVQTGFSVYYKTPTTAGTSYTGYQVVYDDRVISVTFNYLLMGT